MSRRRSRGSLPRRRRHDWDAAPPAPRGPACTYCGRDLAALPVRVVCKHSACKDAPFCIDCFSVGAALAPHAPAHPYAITERLDQPLFAPDWPARDEIALLDAIATHGPDNWSAVASTVGRSALKCEAHYRAVYLDSDTAPLPSDELLFAAPPRKRPRQLDSPSPSLPPSPMPVLTGVAKKAPVARDGGFDETGGIEDLADDIVADVEVGEDDTEEEVELKFQLVELYNERLVLREAVKKYVDENGEGSFSKAMANTKKSKRYTKGEKDYLAELEVFERVFTRLQMKKFTKAALTGLRIGKELDKLLAKQKAKQPAGGESEDASVGKTDTEMRDQDFFEDSADSQLSDSEVGTTMDVSTPSRGMRKPKDRLAKRGDFAYIILKTSTA